MTKKLLAKILRKYHHAMCLIGETCVDVSKSHIDAEDAIEKIRSNIYYNSDVSQAIIEKTLGDEEESFIELVINGSYCGFSLSKEAYDFLGLEWDDYGLDYSNDYAKRSDPKLVECVKKLGEKANGRSAKLKIVKIPANIEWYIDDFYGAEIIHEGHRTWS